MTDVKNQAAEVEGRRELPGRVSSNDVSEGKHVRSRKTKTTVDRGK